MSDVKKGQAVLTVPADHSGVASVGEVNSILVKIQERLTKLESKQVEDGSRAQKRHNTIVDILLQTIKDQGERIDELAE